MPVSSGNPVRRASVGRHYRHWIAWVAALILHALIIGVVADWRLGPEKADSRPVSLDVVLTTQPAVEAGPAQAIAEANQQAIRRNQAESPPAPPAPMPPSAPAPAPEPTPDEAPAEANEPPAAPTPEKPATPEPAPRAEPTPLPAPADEPKAPSEPETPESPPAANAAPSGQALLAQASASIRSREFEVPDSAAETGDRDRQAARRAAEARYVADWTRRVETYGNRFYPAPSELDGQLRIRVVIDRDGQVRQAEVVQSSGHPELDQAALKTVHGAAPYRPFDSGMGNRDRLTITRVWRFGKGNNFGVR